MDSRYTILDRVVRFGRNSKTRAAGLGLRSQRAELSVLVLAATKRISNYTKHLAETPNDTFMKGAEWSAQSKFEPAA